jgi:hypothetical protein
MALGDACFLVIDVLEVSLCEHAGPSRALRPFLKSQTPACFCISHASQQCQH